MYERIMVPVNGPPHGDPGMEHGIELARCHDASITAVHVVRTDRIASVPMESGWPGVTAIARREGEEVLEAIREYAQTSAVPIDPHLAEGAPSREIISAAEEVACDLIVMATSGRAGLNRLLLGSVTERVVRQAPVPVLTVRHPLDHSRGEAVPDSNVTGEAS